MTTLLIEIACLGILCGIILRLMWRLSDAHDRIRDLEQLLRWRD